MELESILRNNREPNADEFLPTLVCIFTMARCFGIPSYGGRLAFFSAVIILCMLVALEIGALWKLVRLLTGVATNSIDNRGLIGRLSGSIFYGNALFSLIFSWQLLSSWKEVSKIWNRAETSGMHIPPDNGIRRRMIGVASFVGVCACVEHLMSMVSATGFDFPPEEYFHRYILNSHGFLLQKHEYRWWLAIPIFILSKVATILWNFQDLLIIVISMGLTSRYHRLNICVSDTVRIEKKDKDVPKFGTELYLQVQVWRRLREAYVRQASLVRAVDKKIGTLVLLSNMSNFYFICLQLYSGLSKGQSGGLINRVYYFYSVTWLLVRACSVVLAAADVNVHSKSALPMLYTCPSSSWNIELKRLKHQLTNDVVGISGKGLFTLNRELLLQVAAAILKYELVLIQYNSA